MNRRVNIDPALYDINHAANFVFGRKLENILGGSLKLHQTKN